MTDDTLLLLDVPTTKRHAGEWGVLAVRNGLLVRPDGSIYQWRGASLFKALERMRNGENLNPVVEELIALGCNLVRIFVCYNNPQGLGHLDPRDSPTFYDDVRICADYFATRGMRVEFTHGDTNNLFTDHEAHQHARNLKVALTGCWNVSVEAINEAGLNENGSNARAVDMAQELLGAGFLVATGIYPHDPDWLIPEWSADYGTVHSERKPEWPRVPRELDDLRKQTIVPWAEDEPPGAAEADRGYSRSTNADDFAYYAATAALMGAGATLHSDSGVEAIPLGPIQKQCAKAFFDALQWVPVDAQTWPYQRGGSTPGCEFWVGGGLVEHDDARELRSFGKSDGQRAYVVQIRTNREHATACPGWRITKEPRKGFVELSR